MFRMTASVEFEGLKAVKPSSLKWKRHIDNYSDSATIEIPAICRYKDGTGTYDNVVTGQKLFEGQKVKIYAGYDGNNDLQFDGFIKRINSSTPLEIECEGYSYQLRNKTINKSFGRTTVKKVLEKLVVDTAIKIDNKLVGDITFEPKQFPNIQRTQVLDWLKEEYRLKVFFLYNELHVGFGLMFIGNTVKHQLNWNVIKDSDLLFNAQKEATVNIEGVTKLDDGTLVRITSKNARTAGEKKEVKLKTKDRALNQKIVDALQSKQNKKGYVGAITGFLKPFVQIGDSTQITDNKFKERAAQHVVDGIDGSFSRAGGRQKIHIDFSTGKI
jgi:hypothetical protein